MDRQDESVEPTGKPERELSNLVVVGASAGGIDSLSVLVSTLPADFPAPVVVGLHLSPSRVSSLGDILSRRGPLPVQTISDRVALEPGTIYVVPSNRHVRIVDQHAVLEQDGDGPQPSVDLLFRSAAEAYGENLIAVVLSGTGSDGAVGARDVKAAGGTVIVQNPDTAAFPGMPLSLSPSVVDFIANRDRIGGLLTDFVNGGFVEPPASEHSLLQSFLAELREESGVDFTTYRQATIHRRIQRRMVATGQPSLPDYVRFVRQHPEERRRLTSSFLINVTQFFRDPELFDYLRDQVLPELMDEARNRGEDLRIWSAGCSTGEEAYSLAIMVSELRAQEGMDLNVRIFATDLDDEAVAFARRGFYSAHALGALPHDLVAKYFTPQGDEYEVKKHLRGMLVFGEHDLAQRAPFPRIDLTLCRNVLIYFTPALQRRALQMFAFSLRNGGFLVLGKSESVNPLAEHFAVDQPRLKVFRRVGSRPLILPSGIQDATHQGTSQQAVPRPPTSRLLTPPPRARDTGRGHSPLNGERMLHRLPFGVVVVDRAYDIQEINGEARRLFGIHTTALRQDLIHLVQQIDAMQLRRLIDTAVQSQQGAQGLLVSNRALGEAQQSIEVLCTPLNDPDTERDGLVVISAIDVTEREQLRYRQVAAEERSARLARANEEVLDANQELTRTISRLRDENEQMLVASVEIQAATEEVETLNEELQASNEELETLNEELQATVEELNTTNDDLQARTLELQTLALRGESFREQLRTILDAVDDAVVVVDASGSIVLQNRLYNEFFGHDVSTPAFMDAKGRTLDDEQSPIMRASRGERFTVTFHVRSASGAMGHYEAMGRPVAMVNGPRLGVVTIRPLPEPEPWEDVPEAPVDG